MDSENTEKEPTDSVDGVSVMQTTSAPDTPSPVVSEVASTATAMKPLDDLTWLADVCAKLAADQFSPMEGSKSQASDSILQLLVTEDMSTIKSSDVLNSLFVDHLRILPTKVISEVLSVLVAIVKKSVFHLESARGLLIPCIEHLLSDVSDHSQAKLAHKQTADSKTSSGSSVSLTKHFLREWINLLIAHSCDVGELKSILKFSEHDPSLLAFIQQANTKQRNRPPAFFAFPGTKGSMISLPPFQKWPIQFGWSFSTWFFLEPKTCSQPYLYNFKTGKSGLGYSAHFTGNCLVLTSIRVKGKGVQHCVAYEFPSYKWIHCAITYHNKWRASEIKVYVNGQLAANIEMPWQVQTNEIFDKCFIGGSGSITTNDRSGELNCFSGQMSALYLFNEGLGPVQICAIHRLGPSYMGQFKYSNESCVNLPPQICKALYEEKLASSLFSLFTPVAVDSATLCIQLAPFKSSTSPSAHNYFISAPHAALLGGSKAIITQPICSTLQSIGCSRSLLPLLDVFASKGKPQACASLVEFLCDLLDSSPHWFSNEIVQNNGFVVVACALSRNSRLLLTPKLLDIFLNLTKTLLSTSSTVGDSLLLKHLMDNILFNPMLWIYSDAGLQIKLYSYLATEFLHGTRHNSNKYKMSNSTSGYSTYNPTSSAGAAMSNVNLGASSGEDSSKSNIGESAPYAVTELLFGDIRRVSTVLQSLHALKYYYWMAEESNINPKGRNSKLRPSQSDLITIRSHIISFTRELIFRANTTPLDEVQGLLNYLTACENPENLIDVLDMLSSLLRDHPTSMVAALDQKHGIKVIFMLIGSKSELVRTKAIKLLGLFLSQCSHKKKLDIMGPNNLFMLLCDRLRTNRPMTLATYNALIDVMIEADELEEVSMERPDISERRIENPLVVKVIATLLHEERVRQGGSESKQEESDESSRPGIRRLFINDLWNLIVNSRENRRTILQMSVWQHWLINLIDSTLDDSHLVQDQVLAIFRVLLYHAIRYEYGGWRVWIDTLAIIHTKVSYDEFCSQVDGSSTVNQRSDQLEHAAPNAKSMKPSVDSKESPKPEETKTLDTVDKDRGAHQEEAVSKEEGDQQSVVVSSISERVPHESSGIHMVESSDDTTKGDNKENDNIANTVTDTDTKLSEQFKEVDLTDKDKIPVVDLVEQNNKSLDSVDLAPSRAYRKQSLTSETSNITQPVERPESEISHRQSLTSIPLDDPPTEAEPTLETKAPEEQSNDGRQLQQQAPQSVPTSVPQINSVQQQKATASPAFRIPEFRWGSVLIKLLHDLIFSIECDLYHWRCLTNSTELDALLFSPKGTGNSAKAGAQASTVGIKTPATSSVGASSGSSHLQIESLLQKPENQTYLVNLVHFVSQLADNVIIAAGGLLPLLADATGGTRSIQDGSSRSTTNTCEGLTMAQANSLLYRLVSIVDVVALTATHINLSELEADKSTTSGGILRQCLRLACTVTVKNCLVVANLNAKISAMGIGGSQLNIPAAEFPRDMFNSYQGCSLLSANELFDNSALTVDSSDLIASREYSPYQLPNTNSTPSLLPFQSTPIKDPNKLLQTADISRLQACIYHDASTDSQQSQFLALSSLYFISVLMVSKYRDIIEPKHKQKSKSAGRSSPAGQPARNESLESGFQDGSSSVSSIESNLLNFGKMQPNSTAGASQAASTPTSSTSGAGAGSALTDMLTTKLEITLDSICPLLKALMCDFSTFLSKTLIGSHGQDLVMKEIDRTFGRANASPVELVMLLCSQEWQNTLQKNAGLAFIELINEGRVLSQGMKDHIVRVAMEAEFILSRLRADDVAKHEVFGLACSEIQASRLHEEVLINSLISSAARRDHALYVKFRESIQKRPKECFKLDIWEDDDRRKRRFVIDCWDDLYQNIYNPESRPDEPSLASAGSASATCDTKRILDLQKTIDQHCLPTRRDNLDESSALHVHASEKELDDCAADDDDFEDDDEHNESNSVDSDENQQVGKQAMRSNGRSTSYMEDEEDSAENEGRARSNAKANKGAQRLFTKGAKFSHQELDPNEIGADAKGNQIWDFDECASVNDFTGSVIFAAECSLIWSIYAIPGVFQLTSHELYFEPAANINEAIDMLKKEPAGGQTDQTDDEDEKAFVSLRSNGNHGDLSLGADGRALRKIDLKVLRYCDFLTCNGKVALNDIRAIFSRQYLLQPHALEIFLASRTSVMFAFADYDTVKRAVKYLPPVGVGIKYGIHQSRRASLMSPRQLFAASNMTQKWQKREIGNFQYLMFLNTIAGRTYQDLNQYPVFPWILTNYESEELDLNLPTNFRDLSKPVGALNNKRRTEFIERYQSWDNPKIPAFHYGTHYSTAAFTLNWMCRLRGPFNSAYLALQDGKYEEDSRLFQSIGDSWVSSLTGGQQNVKELIPEFFYLPEMLRPNLGLPEVEYPPWAKSAEQFVRIHRLALESELVSCQLHQWVDLIFGYKQRGPEAVSAINTFYYLTYQGSVNLNMIQDSNLRDAIETQIKHFGQTPSQLTSEPHPPRLSALHVSPLVFATAANELNHVIKFPFNTSIVHISPCVTNYIATNGPASDGSSPGTLPSASSANIPSSVLTVTSNNQYQIHKWLPGNQNGHPFTMDPQLEHSAGSAGSRRQLIDVDDLCSAVSLKLTSYKYSAGKKNVVDEVQWTSAHYIVTFDGRYIIMASFYDNSFRVFTTDSGKLCQVIYGHRAPITCLVRSEGNAAADFYIATGSSDCSLLLWTWNDKYAQVEGGGVSAVHNPLPKLTISGHVTPVLSAFICSELGLIVSGSKNLILVNTTTTGECLLELNLILPDMLDRSSLDEHRAHLASIQRPQVKDKQRTILEASMLGNGPDSEKLVNRSQGDRASDLGSRSPSLSHHSSSSRFSHLRDLCRSDYYVTNLQIARELAFIVCVVLPPPKRKTRLHSITNDDNSMPASTTNSAALLMTFNLKGVLMDSTTIGQAANGPRLGDVCALQLSRDGEHLILNDSPSTLKIYRTFDLQPVYAYNTNDIPNALSEDQNRVKSLALLDHKFVLVGLDNGKIIVYNADLKNPQ